MKPKNDRNPNRRRGMHPARDFDTLAADLARFDFSTRSGAHGFYCHAVEKWTAGEIIRMRQMSPRMTGDDPAAVTRAIDTLDELKAVALMELGAGADRGYLGAKRTHGGTMLDPGGLLEKTIRELQAGHAPRNAHPRKQRGTNGQAVKKTEAANALGITRPTLDKYLTNPTPPFGYPDPSGDPDKDINYLAAVMSNRANFAAFIQKPEIVAWIKHRNKAIDGETVHPERIEDVPDPKHQQPPAKPTNIHRNRTA